MDEPKKIDTVYAQPIKIVVERIGFQWECPKCGHPLQLVEGIAVKKLMDGGFLSGKECPNPECGGPETEYRVRKQLLVSPNQGPNRAIRRAGLATQRKTGLIGGKVNGG